MTSFAALLVAALGTYALRSGSVPAFTTRTLQDRNAVLLRHAALAIMASLTIASLPGPAGNPQVTLASSTALAVAVLVARRVSDTTAIIGLAVAAYTLVNLIAP